MRHKEVDYVKEIKENRDVTLDFLKSIACIAVVLLHSTAPFWYATPIKLMPISEYIEHMSESVYVLPSRGIGYYVCSFIDALTRFSIPCFVMVSGALLIEKKLSFNYLKKKVLHFIFLIMFWGTVYKAFSVANSILQGETVSIISVIKGIILGPGIFWYIYMLIPLYITSPVAKHIVENKKVSQIFIVAWFAFTVLFCSLESFIPKLGLVAHTAYTSVYSLYGGYFVLGAYYRRYMLKSSLEKIIVILGVASLIVMTFGRPEGFYHNFTTVFCFLYSFSVFILVHKIQFNKMKLEKFQVYVSCFAGYTMGIYAMHSLVLDGVRKLWSMEIAYWPLQLIIYTLSTLTVSAIFTAILKKNRVLKNVF